MKVKRTISNGLRVTSFVAALGVVLIHSSFLLGRDPRIFSMWCQTYHQLLCKYLVCWCVPFFFAASGFWFVNGQYFRGKVGTVDFWRRKIKTLFIPYLCWGAMAMVLGLPLVVFYNKMHGDPLWARTAFQTDGLWDFIDQVFGLMQDAPCHNGTLWFLRTLLIIFFFCAQLLKLFKGKFGAFLLIFGWLTAQVVNPYMSIPGIHFRVGQGSYFLLGMAIAILLPRKLIETEGRDAECHLFLPRWIGWSFWLYCIHHSVTIYLRAIAHQMLGESDWAAVGATPVIFILTVVICLLTAKICNKYVLRVFELLCGGRQ